MAFRSLPRPLLWLPAVLALLYGGAHLGWYWATPLGRSAVLDERENLQLAAQIAEGRLPPEPFYRAMGYPLVLSGLHAAGLVSETAPFAATALGLLLHVLNTVLVARLAARWFASDRAGLLAGLLHGLNPVLIHFATQVLDGTLADAFFLLGLQFLPRPAEPPAPRRAVGLSLAWAAAALTRPQFLPVWLALPFVWLAARHAWRDWRAQLRPLAVAMAAGAVPWLALAAWGGRTGGEFRLLPWQGPYNLWAANQPAANGRYYAQTLLLELPPGAAHENPARLESIQLYRQATGDTGPLHIGAFNRYWTGRLAAEIRAAPAAWVRLELRKLYYLANDSEQYNNKTYAFHKALSPWLRFNPLDWGGLLLAAALGAVALARTARPVLSGALLTAAAVTAGIMLGYVSARFRLPLVTGLCVLAGGALAAPAAWWPDTARGRAGIVALLLGLGGLTFSTWSGVADRSTYTQDHLLLASAAERTGDDHITWEEARAALAAQPGHPTALRLALTSGFNLMLTTPLPAEAERDWINCARQLRVRTPAPALHPQANVMALALWRAHDPAGAQLWRERLLATNDPDTLAALCLAGQGSPQEVQELARRPLPAAPSALALMARARFFPAELEAWARGKRNAGWLATLRRATDNLFPPP